MSVKNLDFNQLKAALLKRIGQPGMPSRTAAANTLSALAKFLLERKLAPTDVVGSTLRLRFHVERDEHLATLRAAGRSVGYIKNRSGLLQHWHKLIRALDHEAATLDRVPTPLQLALQAALEGRKVKTTARRADIPFPTLRRWLAGTLPRPGTDHYLTRLEEACELAPKALTDLLPYNAVNRAKSEVDGPQIDYRRRHSLLVRDHYKLRPSTALAALRAEWQALIAYKTSTTGATAYPSSAGTLSALARLRGARAVAKDETRKQWRLVAPDRSEILTEARWVDVIAGQECATAKLVFNYVAAFMGWAQLSLARGGRGLSAETAQTLGLFCNEELLNGFIEWRVERSEGINSWIPSFLTFAAMLLHPTTGFLTKRPDIGACCGVAPADWAQRCLNAHTWISDYKLMLSDSDLVRPGRDPKEAIRASLDLPMPLDHFTQAIRRLECRPPSEASGDEAVWARDLLLLALTTSNPLRALNLRRLTYRPDNTGQLRQNSAGEWRIVIERSWFKNVKGAAKHHDYDQAVDPAVWPHIRRYLKDYRKLLGGTRPELVFVSSVDPNRLWKGLNRRFEVLTRRYVPGCPGVGPHAMRHIVCTSIILGGGSFQLAADTLHDREATIRKHYSHLTASNNDRGRKEVLGRTLAQMAAKPVSPTPAPNPTA